jgi:hypothetical protein
MAPKNIKSKQHHKTDGLKISKKHPDVYVEEHCIFKGGKKETCDLIVFEDKKANWHIEYEVHNGKRHNMSIKSAKTSTQDHKKSNTKKAGPQPVQQAGPEPIQPPRVFGKSIQPGSQVSQENYFNCPCANNVEGQHTGHPLTSHETKKFNNSVTSRSDYDQYWLKVYNTYTNNVNYNLA